ncbi:hypothetical protein ABFS82_03G032200 [Erythranthe guttata]|uniref:Lecithin-cholesterol acyltransferase n=1 Tax=Erythranthe guttata TaxID=4155 RepID=A0A022R0T9_ERYGU|nr:PREDICTED: lecithin-cholesterol acyltransferase-like 1 [Erythranthe guttata]EYU32390.1 hypothetical protein MIMGU_mgv1a006497mg [Erythranthe guttata]|eukprot:XP_012843389.1 PREDICTED: lecithin-cholesterol acyltransferase-like 1 [Erythranthe guttata]
MNNFHLNILLYTKMAILSMLAMAASSSSSAAANVHPVILIPGSGGNQLEARLTSEYKSSSLVCNKWYPLKKDPDGWFRLWFDPTVIFRPFTKCFNRRMMIYYDPDEDDYHNAPGVETRVPHFGSIQSLLYLNPTLKGITSYMKPLVKSLEKVGYVSGNNLFGAPYDFRYALAAEGHPSKVASKYLADLKTLIESASASNGARPVILLTHSLGGLFALHLLNRSPISWRQKYIKRLITLAAPWGGTVGEMLTYANGNSFGVPLVDPLLVRDEQRSAASNLWLMPSPRVFNESKPLVVMANGTHYTSSDIGRFLGDIGFPEGVGPYETRVLPLGLRAPQVPVTCVVGTGVKTPEKLIYGGSGFGEQPVEIVYGDGDGTVNMVSLLAVETEWGGCKNQSLEVIKIDGVSHTEILKDENALGKIVGVVSSVNSGISMSSLVVRTFS